MIDGVEHELNFWRDFVTTPRFLEGWCANKRTPELQDLTYEFIISQLPAKVLDCGSGVCSILHGTVPNEDLTVCDLLGDEYAKFFDYSQHNIVKPLPFACEDLPYKNEFDIVHISNALDHTQDAILAYLKLREAVKPGGYLIIQGFENEGIYENWQGLHQWNIALYYPDRLGITAKSGITYTPTDTPILAERTFVPTLDKYWITYITRK